METYIFKCSIRCTLCIFKHPVKIVVGFIRKISRKKISKWYQWLLSLMTRFCVTIASIIYRIQYLSTRSKCFQSVRSTSSRAVQKKTLSWFTTCTNKPLNYYLFTNKKFSISLSDPALARKLMTLLARWSRYLESRQWRNLRALDMCAVCMVMVQHHRGPLPTTIDSTLLRYPTRLLFC